jgi:iron complex outermembrane receptor protein
VFTHTLSLQWKAKDFTVTGGVRNIFDQKAPNVSNTEFRNGTAALNGYNDQYLGRQFFIGISKKF